MSNRDPVLLLFDIDGTLLRVTGGSRRALLEAVSTVTGSSVSIDGVSFAGRTDPAIFRDVLAKNEIAVAAPDFNAILQTYAEVAQETIRPTDVEVLPGVCRLLAVLGRRRDVALGLVTGNVRPVANHKLEVAGLREPFLAGAFGSDHSKRKSLPPLAIQRVADQTAIAFSRETTVVVGDTPHDIRCAQQSGLRSVAVCTGRPNRAALAACTPDLLLDTFEQHDDVIDRLVRL